MRGGPGFTSSTPQDGSSLPTIVAEELNSNSLRQVMTGSHEFIEGEVALQSGDSPRWSAIREGEQKDVLKIGL